MPRAVVFLALMGITVKDMVTIAPLIVATTNQTTIAHTIIADITQMYAITMATNDVILAIETA